MKGATSVKTPSGLHWKFHVPSLAEPAQFDQAREDIAEYEAMWPPNDDYRGTARRLMREEFSVAPLHRWRGQWYRWRGTHWMTAEPEEINKVIWDRLEHVTYLTAPRNNAPAMGAKWKPNKQRVANVLEALSTAVLVPDHVEVPSWVSLDRGMQIAAHRHGDASGVIAFENGLLRLSDRALIEHTPEFFNQFALPFEYDSKQTVPRLWMKTLDQWFPRESRDAIDVIQEWFGYVLSGRTDLQQALYIQGVSRSGKGTLVQVLEWLVGRVNVSGGLSADNLSKEYGLQDAIGKALLVFPDIHFAANAKGAVETMKKLIGEDALSINRKYLPLWDGRLPGRVVFTSNFPPKFPDASNAAVKRLICIQMDRRFEGPNKNAALKQQLKAELPAILTWALDGLERLSARGHFVQPASGMEVLEAARDNASPIGSFLDDCCEVDPQGEVLAPVLFEEWKSWCIRNGNYSGNNQTFGQNLKAHMADQHPGARFAKRRPGADKEGRRPWTYSGVQLRRPVKLKSVAG